MRTVQCGRDDSDASSDSEGDCGCGCGLLQTIAKRSGFVIGIANYASYGAGVLGLGLFFVIVSDWQPLLD